MIEPTHWKLVSNLRLTAGGQAFFVLLQKKIKNVSPLAAAYLGDVAVSNRALKSLPLFLTTYFSRVNKRFFQFVMNIERGLGILGTPGTLGHQGHRGHQRTPMDTNGHQQTPMDTMTTSDTAYTLTLGTSGTPRTPRQKGLLGHWGN